MRSALRENRTEALVGLAVVLVSLAFVLLAWQRTGGGGGGMQVTALFPSANGISVGTDVRVAGLKVGQVAAQKLDPKSFQAEVTLALQDGLKIPADSSAAITTESLLGGSYVALIPGGESKPMKNGDVITETQGAVDMMSLIGGVINRTGQSAPAAGVGGSTLPGMDDPLPESAGSATTNEQAR